MKESTNKNTNIRETTKTEHEELMNVMSDIAKAVDHWYSSFLNGDPRGKVWHAWRMFHVIEDYDDDDELYLEEEEMALLAVVETFSLLNHPSGWFLMGYLFEVGICYMHNKKKAMEYYRKAAAAGAEFAKDRLETMRKGKKN